VINTCIEQIMYIYLE